MNGRQVYARVEEPSQVGAARRRFAGLARTSGFPDEAVGRVALAVTELATNMIRHATGGELFGRRVEVDGTGSLEILAVDRGPGIADPERALEDGYTTAGGSGLGLGAVARSASLMGIHTPGDAGTVLMVRVDRDPDAVDRTRAHHDLGVVERPHPAEEVSGDGWAVREEAEGLVVMVCDGLGHGRHARAASDKAVATFHDASWRGLSSLLERLHDDLRATRGAAISIATVDPGRNAIRYAGVGNVAGAVVAGSERFGFVSRNGTVGHQMRSVKEYDYEFPGGSLLVMHSDGLRSRWDVGGFQEVLHRPAPVVAATFYLLHARSRDDATVLVLRNRG